MTIYRRYNSTRVCGALAAAFVLVVLGMNRTVLPEAAAAETTESPQKRYLRAADEGDTQTLRVLLDEHPELVTHRTPAGTGLHFAAGSGHAEAVSLLIERGVDIDAVDPAGETALHRTAVRGNVEMARLLIAKGADVNVGGVPDESSRDAARFAPTPLDKAAFNRQIELARLLLKHGAKIVREPEVDRVTAIHAACTPRFFYEEGQPIDNHQMIELLLKAGADINALNAGGETPLFWSVRFGKLETVQYLLKRGEVDVALTERSDGKTPLHQAVENACDLVLRVKREELSDIAKKTPRLDESKRSALQIVSTLVQHGADPTKADASGRTPLERARDFPEVRARLASPDRKQ